RDFLWSSHRRRLPKALNQNQFILGILLCPKFFLNACELGSMLSFSAKSILESIKPQPNASVRQACGEY
ncbi:MAG: hypothetical protein ACFFCW_43945, partial [Candidatus Hodarchaeota archaeon]